MSPMRHANETSTLNVRKFPKDLLLWLKATAAMRDTTIREVIVNIVTRERVRCAVKQ